MLRRSEGSLASEIGTIPDTSSRLNQQTKMKNELEKQLLLQNVKMDGAINFQTNGDINIYPCPWEDGKQVTNGDRVRYRGGIEVDADGHARVKRYNDGMNGPKYETLFETAHGAVKMTRPNIRRSDGSRRISMESVYVTFKFPKKYGLALTRSLYKEETDEIMSFLKTRKEETIWG